MRTKIAVVTASGKAYYRLVSELKRKRVPFIIVNPGETLPLNVEVAITTESEKSGVHCSTILTYDEVADPSTIIEEALRVIRGKHRYESLVVGIDPGKDFGIAVIGDGAVLETESVSGGEDAAVEVLRVMEQLEGDRRVVKIGDGADEYRSRLITILDRELPLDVDIESVEEGGTTRNITTSGRRGFRDASSAIKISMRRGRKIVRGSGWRSF